MIRRLLAIGSLATALVAGVAAWGGTARAQPLILQPLNGSAADDAHRLAVYGGIDRGPALPLLKAFQKSHPDIEVDFWDFASSDLYDRFVQETDHYIDIADVVINSAVDLQIKLVNDGYAQPYHTPEAASLPPGTVWRDAAFGFTFEPAVMVYNKRLVPPGDVPHSRADLARLLRTKPAAYDGQIVTYDPERSGLGLLLATQDAEQSDAIWELARTFGATRVQLFSDTDPMLDRIAAGKALIGYNLLGSYAERRHDPRLGIILPTDYTLVLSRIALISRDAPHLANARAFIDFLLSRAGQRAVAASGLNAIRPDLDGPGTAAALRKDAAGPIRPIALGPGLMVYLDPVKRRLFLEHWRHELEGGDVPPGN